MIKVVPIENSKSKPWIIKKHYARRMPPVKYSFALVRDNLIQGIVTYGPPCTNQVSNSILGDKSSKLVLELNRLCLDTDIANAASMLVSRSLRLLPFGRVVVSYADAGMNHCGFIYQACNFIYSGFNDWGDHEYLMNGKWIHPRTMSSMGIPDHRTYAKKHNLPEKKMGGKHRYFYITGSKKDKKNLLSQIKWKSEKYPKSDPSRYDSGPPLTNKEREFIEYPKHEQPNLFAEEVSSADTR